MVRKINSMHFCVAMAAQDGWSPYDTEKVRKLALSTFDSHADHSDCGTCKGCPICRALWELFDPERPGEYDVLCEACSELIPIINKARGSGDGLTLFSHTSAHEDTIAAITSSLLASPKIKKVLILQLDADIRIGPKGPQIAMLLKQESIKSSEFLKLVKARRLKCDTLYEIFKDSYYRAK
jgi:hypothetical protein